MSERELVNLTAGAHSVSPASTRLLTGVQFIVDGAWWLYRVTLAPLFGPCCRFAPSCSVYGREAVRRYGLARGGWMALKRILRCHPLHPGGWDPVV